MTGTDWVPGLIVLGAGLAVGALFVIRTLFRSTPTPTASDVAEAQYRAAIDQLKELKADQHHLEPAAFAAQRAELEQRAAAALRAKETRTVAATPTAPATPKPPPTGWFARHPELKGAAWGGGVVAFFALLFALLVREQKPSPPEMRAQPEAQAPARPDELTMALDHVRSHPDDVEAAAVAGHELIRRQRWSEARQVTERALGFAPFSVEHRIHRAVLMAVDGDPQGAITLLQRLADTYVGSHEALLFVASMVGDFGDKARALDALEHYARVAPLSEQSPQVYEAMAELRSQLQSPKPP